MSRVLVMVGTVKGAFFFRSDEARREWEIEGPLLKGWEVSYLELDRRREPVIWAGVGSFVYGATIQTSRDLGGSWRQIEHGPRYAEGSGRKLERIWTIAPGRADEPDTLWAGVAEAGLFVTRNGGVTWREVEGLSRHPTRQEWSPGFGGLCCHTVLVDPSERDRLWVGISSVGVLRSDDGGESWALKNDGLPVIVPSQDFDKLGSCIHRVVLSPDVGGLLYQQNHQGVFRSTDAGESWHPIQEGLPSEFGFPLVVHPADSKTLYVLPLESSEYRFFIDGQPRVYRTRDGGGSWQALDAGLPANNYAGVLRHALAADGLEACGVYFGTSGGQLFYSRDEGESWQAMDAQLPRILCVAAAAVD